MIQGISFLIERFFYRIGAFATNWYVRGSRRFLHGVIFLVERLDRTFAVVITLRNLFKPMYGDYSPVGYAFGFIFRLLRVVIASVIYAVVFACGGVVYVIWVVMPPALLSIFLLGLLGFHVL